MTDVFTPEKRSNLMSKIRSKDTKPELVLRKALHRLGYRFRLHVKDLPGKPDIVLPKYKTVIQVRGCFWHGHNCIDGHIPKTRVNYWKPKIEGNIRRDRRNCRLLRKEGWSVINTWECKLTSQLKLKSELSRIIRLLNRTKTKYLILENSKMVVC